MCNSVTMCNGSKSHKPFSINNCNGITAPDPQRPPLPHAPDAVPPSAMHQTRLRRVRLHLNLTDFIFPEWGRRAAPSGRRGETPSTFEEFCPAPGPTPEFFMVQRWDAT